MKKVSKIKVFSTFKEVPKGILKTISRIFVIPNKGMMTDYARRFAKENDIPFYINSYPKRIVTITKHNETVLLLDKSTIYKYKIIVT